MGWYRNSTQYRQILKFGYRIGIRKKKFCIGTSLNKTFINPHFDAWMRRQKVGKIRCSRTKSKKFTALELL